MGYELTPRLEGVSPPYLSFQHAKLLLSLHNCVLKYLYRRYWNLLRHIAVSRVAAYLEKFELHTRHVIRPWFTLERVIKSLGNIFARCFLSPRYIDIAMRIVLRLLTCSMTYVSHSCGSIEKTKRSTIDTSNLVLGIAVTGSRYYWK